MQTLDIKKTAAYVVNSRLTTVASLSHFAMGVKQCVARIHLRQLRLAVKLAFHGADTDTDTDTDFLADLSAELSDERAFLARMSVRDARVYTSKRVLYTISYRDVPNVGVGVVEFQFNDAA